MVVVVDVLVVALLAWWGVELEHAASTSPATPAAASAPQPRRDPVEVAWERCGSMIGVLIVGDAPGRGGYLRTWSCLGKVFAAAPGQAT